MADSRYRYPPSGRRSPTFNPARASMPVSIGYNSPYSGDLHVVPTARYDAAAPRYPGDPRAPSNATTTVTTYNVTKDPLARSSSHTEQRHPRHRSSTLESRPAKPIIVTTNHPRPSATSSSHQSSSTRTTSPSRDPYRSGDDAYYTQPASSSRSRSAQRHSYSHGHSQSATLDNDEFYRLRERVGDDRIRAPLRAGTADAYRQPHHQPSYSNVRPNSSAVVDYEDDGYEYTKPSDLARYDLDHDISRNRRRESFDRPYYRPTVNVISNEPTRFENSRGRKPPPTSAGLERYNRNAAAGVYERPTVTMPTLPAVPAPPLVDPARRLESSLSPTVESQGSRPRPISMYQDPSPRMSYPDDIHRSRDDERVHKDRRDREDSYRDDNVATRGFGIRTDTLEPVDRRDRDRDERRGRREYDEREPKRSSDEALERARSRSQLPSDESRSKNRVEHSVERKDSKDSSRTDKVREKVATGLTAAAAAIGIASVKDKPDDKDTKVSPRRRRDSSVEVTTSRAAERYKPRDHVEQKPPRDEPIVVEQKRARETVEPSATRREPIETKPEKVDPIIIERRGREPVEPRSSRDDPIVIERREPAKERTETRERSDSRERERDREREHERDRERERDRDREREKERDREREREREKERDRERERERDKERQRERDAEKDREREHDRDRDRERHRRETEEKLNGTGSGPRNNSPPSDGATDTSRRRSHRASTAFNPLDTKGLMDLKAELAAKEQADKLKERSPDKGRTADADTNVSSGSDKSSGRAQDDIATAKSRDSSRPPKAQEESRGRDLVPASEEREKQVRVVSPPRDKSSQKPIKGILKQPTRNFPEENNPIREGVAPHKDDKTKKDVPAGARWTKINRRMVNPEALTIGKERFEVRDDFVIVLRVLSKEEIQAYATATAQLREMRRKQSDREGERGKDYDDDRDRSDEERRRRHHSRRDRDDDDEYHRRGRDRDDRDRPRRPRGEDNDGDRRPKLIGYDDHAYQHRHRSHRADDDSSVMASVGERR